VILSRLIPRNSKIPDIQCSWNTSSAQGGLSPEIRFSKNGEDLGKAFTINPQLKSSAFFPAVVLKNAEMLFNFGDQPWKNPPPKVLSGSFF
jgi:hypothetical protein